MPIRVKLTLLFSGVMAVLLAALSGFLYLRFRADLDYNIDQSLRARAQEVASLVSGADVVRDPKAFEPLSGRGVNFVQILDRQGHVLAASPGYDAPPLLSPAEAAAAANRPLLLKRHEQSRLYSLAIDHRRALVVAGVSLAERDAALDKLDDALVRGGPLALLLASIAAYGLAAAALRPVETMRRRAATISTDDLGARLPLPDSVDEIHRLGETLNEMLDRLEDGLVRERSFVANASHELRTPLAILKAELEVALREQGSVEQLTSSVSSAVEETDRIIRLAEDLLLLARAEQGELPLQTRELQVRDLLRELAARPALQAERAGRPLLIDCDVDEAVLKVDVDRMQQAFINLIDNALRYGSGTVTLGARHSGSSIDLHVTDQGPGFPIQFLPRAFERFSRADPARSRGGAGLGLAIVRTIAEAHHAEAHAENADSGGADVWLSFPVS